MASRLAPIALLGIALGAATLLWFYGGGREDVREVPPAERTRTSREVESVPAPFDAAAAVATGEAAGDEPSQSSDHASPVASALQVFLEARGIQVVGRAAQDLREFVAQPRELWSAGMEARFQSALTAATGSGIESYVECRHTLCIVIFVHLPQTDVEQLRGVSRGEHQRLLSALGLYGTGVSLLQTQSGALVEWHRFHRRCGPDWQCLE